MIRFLLVLFLVLVVTMTTHASVVVSSNSRLNRIQHLHAVLSIGDNPNEDIRTNQFLALEGI